MSRLARHEKPGMPTWTKVLVGLGIVAVVAPFALILAVFIRPWYETFR